MKILRLPKNLDHQQINLLLPWYANGTLSETEALMVKRHLQQCHKCRTALTDLQQLATIVHEAPDLGVSSEVAFNQLWRQVESRQNRHRRSFNFSWPIPWGPGLFSSPLALALSLLIIVVPLTFMVFSHHWLNSLKNQDYRTLSSSQPSQFRATDIRVIFVTPVNQNHLKELLQPLGKAYSIVAEENSIAGHSSYVLRFEGQPGRDKTLQQLRELPLVIFAEPASPFIHEARPSGEKSS